MPVMTYECTVQYVALARGCRGTMRHDNSLALLHPSTIPRVLIIKLKIDLINSSPEYSYVVRLLASSLLESYCTSSVVQ
jgi:hypothetical protein